MNICVVGTGYVGLVAATCFAESGNDVVGVDIDTEKVARLQRGEVPIYEPGLEELLQRNLAEKRLSFTTNLAEGVAGSEIVYIAVGTPPGPDGEADMRYVYGVAEEIADAMDGYRIIVTKSTVPVGTAEEIRRIVASRTDHPFDVASNPEFMKEGAALDDFLKPDRVVIGTDSPKVAAILTELYEPFVRTGNPILVMDIRSAEMTKYAANAMLALRISFINEVANLCERIGANVDEVRRGIATDSRIGPAFLFPGPGYGGSCFPKDVKALSKIAQAHDYPFRLLEATDRVNEAQKQVLFEKTVRHFGKDLSKKSFGIWGMAFKPRTDDMREAPAIPLIENLLAHGACVRAYDPEAMKEARKIFGERITYADNAYEALRDADALIIVTEWNEFRRPNFQRIRSLLRTPVIVDGRNIFPIQEMRKLGFTYYSIGRPAIVEGKEHAGGKG
ncbi:MAG: UDP-glucose/GDP-mannose dehydrogenase family protein [Deltaproteobacteria bacterium]|nr:MAG: UDP-glucose/GDP-mannose dehydrogenase family protein [Deltaproteobacteria bacterium]